LFLGLAMPLFTHAAPTKLGEAVLLLDGKEAARFAEVAGGGAEIEVLTEVSPGESIVRKRPGKVKYANITLKRGRSSDATLHSWFSAALAGAVERKSGSIIYLDREGNEVLRLNLLQAWPTAFEVGPTPDENGDIAVESFTISFVDFERVLPSVPRRASDFLPTRDFRVEIDGRRVTGVLWVSEAGATVDMTDAGLPLVNAKSVRLLLDRSAPTALFESFRQAGSGKDIRKSISVVLLARGEQGRRYTLFEAWPMRWKAPELNATSDSYIVEELEFAVERIERK